MLTYGVAAALVLLLVLVWLGRRAEGRERQAAFDADPLAFERPVGTLRMPPTIYPAVFFYRGDVKVGYFDLGPGQLVFGSGRSYEFSNRGSELVDKPVLPPGTAEICCLIDRHYRVVEDTASANLTIHSRGATTHYKSGTPEVVAHWETPFERTGERLIVHGGKHYTARYGKRFRAELTDAESGEPVARLRPGIRLFRFVFSFRMEFVHPLPLRQGIVLAWMMLASGVDGSHPFPDMRKGGKARA